ncbi:MULTISPECIES: DUF2732 family protein [unclassified Serratia (in: enterobacteria)]|uniref:DUF2732 family protein n=1 Tax=unclassified Serratia (in: enterobacteria) TaxID=2647522 RepID=UPI00211929F2|nr:MULTISPECIES: DUF2732 family protein [unclassified Serratia (in: enterobacteria)]
MKFETAKDVYELPLDVMLHDVRMDERRNRAEVMSSRLNVLAWRITSGELNHVEAAELLRQEAKRYQHQAQELH